MHKSEFALFPPIVTPGIKPVTAEWRYLNSQRRAAREYHKQCRGAHVHVISVGVTNFLTRLFVTRNRGREFPLPKRSRDRNAFLYSLPWPKPGTWRSQSSPNKAASNRVRAGQRLRQVAFSNGRMFDGCYIEVA